MAAPTPHRISGNAPIAIALAFAIMAVRLFQLTYLYAVNIFFWDEWDFNDATLFQNHNLWEMFRWQHGPHRMGLGAILMALVEPWFQWNSRTEAFIAAGFVVIAAALALYLKWRLFGPLAWPDLTIPIVMLSAARWDMVWTTVDLAIGIFPILIVLYCLLWLWKNERLKYGAITLLSFTYVYTGFALFLALFTPVLLVCTYRADRTRVKAVKIYLLCCIAVSVISVASFFAGYKVQSDSGCASIFSARLSEYFWFADLMYITAFGITSVGWLAKAAGGIVMVLVVGVAAFHWIKLLRPSAGAGPRDLAIAVLGTHAILYTVGAAVGRTCLGLEAAHSSRYTLYMQMSVLSLYFFALTLRPLGTVRPAVVLLFLLFPSLVLRRFDDDALRAFSYRKSSWRACYLSGKSVADCDRIVGKIARDPEGSHLQEKLDYLKTTQQNLFADAPDIP